MRLTGFEAITFAEREGLSLNKLADAIDDAQDGLSIAEAEAIAVDRPELIFIDITADEYDNLSDELKEVIDTVRLPDAQREVSRRAS